MRNLKVSQRGSALLITMALMVMLSLLAIVSTDRATTDINLSYNQLNSENAFYMADAGIKHALTVLNDSLNWRTGFANTKLGKGSYLIAIIDTVVRAGLDDTVIISSTSTVSDASSNIDVITVPNYISPFQYAAFGKDSLLAINGACVDSYDSDSGTYAATQLNDLADVGSNGNIYLGMSADIYGDVSTATADGITIGHPTVNVTGDTTSSAPEQTIPGISPENFADAKLNSNAPAGLSGTFTYNNGRKSLTMGTRDTLIFASGVYFFTDITIGGLSSIQLAPGADVTIYMTGDFTLGNHTKVNLDGNPADFKIFSSGAEFNVGQLSKFYGAFYGPNADATVSNNTNYYGSLVAGSILIENSGCIHFDRSLTRQKVKAYNEYQVVAWKQL